MPSQGAASSVNQNTEQRWLCKSVSGMSGPGGGSSCSHAWLRRGCGGVSGRMVSNASKELKQRVEVDKEIGAAEEEAEDARTSLQAASTWGRACQAVLACWHEV